jgi:hypothetical protein
MMVQLVATSSEVEKKAVEFLNVKEFIARSGIVSEGGNLFLLPTAFNAKKLASYF